LHRKEAIYYLIKEILSIDVYNYIFRSIDLKANDSMNKSTIKNTNSCIESIDENFPIDLMNVRDHCFKDNSSRDKSPNCLILMSFVSLDYLTSEQDPARHS